MDKKQEKVMRGVEKKVLTKSHGLGNEVLKREPEEKECDIMKQETETAVDNARYNREFAKDLPVSYPRLDHDAFAVGANCRAEY
ncbi:hypothetical protein TKK_0013823 [Trichogramma kaykai]